MEDYIKELEHSIVSIENYVEVAKLEIERLGTNIGIEKKQLVLQEKNLFRAQETLEIAKRRFKEEKLSRHL